MEKKPPVESDQTGQSILMSSPQNILHRAHYNFVLYDV